MKVKVGDRVKFLNDVGGGTVTKIVDKEIVNILNEDGFEIPVMANELLVVQDINLDYTTTGDSQKKEVKNEPEVIEPVYTGNTEVNIFLAFVPKNQQLLSESDSDVYLINDSDYFISYNYLLPAENGLYKSINGILEPNLKEKIDIFYQDSVKENVTIILQILFFDKKAFKLRTPENVLLKIKAVKFYKNSSFGENDFFNERAMVVSVSDNLQNTGSMQKAVENISAEDIKKAMHTKSDARPAGKRPRTGKKNEKSDTREIDLHIHELIEDETGLSDKDKLEYQMDAFRAEMKAAVKDGIRRIVFIHGKGSGRLKQDIRKELQRDYKKYNFQDASFHEYGYGATMVILK